MKNKFQIRCDECNGSGLIPIASGVRGFRICRKCNGTGFDVSATEDMEMSASDNDYVRRELIDLLCGHSLDTEEDVDYVADILINAGVTIT